jgi:hypothetical protein
MHVSFTCSPITARNFVRCFMRSPQTEKLPDHEDKDRQNRLSGLPIRKLYLCGVLPVVLLTYTIQTYNIKYIHVYMVCNRN